jgi:hypothetical protein
MIYETDPTPNSDQQFCENCECIVDEKDIRETVEGGKGCINCISDCRWCGRAYFSQDMSSDPFFGLICNTCVKSDDYKKGVRNEVISEALRMYFDKLDHKAINQLTIEVTRFEGFTELANEMKNDLSN